MAVDKTRKLRIRPLVECNSAERNRANGRASWVKTHGSLSEVILSLEGSLEYATMHALRYGSADERRQARSSTDWGPVRTIHMIHSPEQPCPWTNTPDNIERHRAQAAARTRWLELLRAGAPELPERPDWTEPCLLVDSAPYTDEEKTRLGYPLGELVPAGKVGGQTT